MSLIYLFCILLVTVMSLPAGHAESYKLSDEVMDRLKLLIANDQVMKGYVR